jgi:dienelactone hydrolase
VLAGRVQRPFTLIGHSMGGAVALAYTAAYPQRVSRLVVVDAAGVLHRSVYAEFLGRMAAQRAIGMDSPWFDDVMRAIQLRAENWPIHADLVLERAGVRRRFFGGDPNAIAAVALAEHDFSAALPAIKAPTLVIWGATDQIAPLRTGQALASAIRGARLVVLEGVAHAPQIEAPQRFNPIVLEEIDGRQLAAPPYALPEGDPQSKRNGSCSSSHGAEFTGDYARVMLDNCTDARIANARIGYLQVANSNVQVVNSHVRKGIDARNARLELTGGSVRGHMVLDAANVDAAATRFADSRVASNAGDSPVVLRFSVVEMSGSGNEPWTLHNIRRLAPGETLIR